MRQTARGGRSLLAPRVEARLVQDLNLSKRDTVLQIVVALVIAMAMLALLVRCRPYRNQQDSHYAVHANAAMVMYIFLSLLLKINAFLVNFMNATGAGADYVLEKQGYGDALLGSLLVATVTAVLVSFAFALYRDLKLLQTDALMRYTDDGSLVFFHKPPLTQSFDVLGARPPHTATL